jgi:hypothetical protein
MPVASKRDSETRVRRAQETLRIGRVQIRPCTGETNVGLFWDLIQQSQISEQRSNTESLSDRVRDLERELREVKHVQLRLLETLEQHFGRDLDGDGRVGT